MSITHGYLQLCVELPVTPMFRFTKELCGTSGGLDLVHRGHLQCGVGRRCVERCLGLCTLIGFSKNSAFGMALEKNWKGAGIYLGPIL